MPAPPADVVDRLEQLATHAPGGGIDPDAVWTHGRRRQRVRLGAALAALVAVGLLGTTTTPLLVDRARRVEPADSADRMVLPDVIRKPGGWEPVYGAAPGRLSAVEAEIAATLGIAPGTVKSQARDGLARLRQALPAEEGAGSLTR